MHEYTEADTHDLLAQARAIDPDFDAPERPGVTAYQKALIVLGAHRAPEYRAVPVALAPAEGEAHHCGACGSPHTYDMGGHTICRECRHRVPHPAEPEPAPASLKVAAHGAAAVSSTPPAPEAPFEHCAWCRDRVPMVDGQVYYRVRRVCVVEVGGNRYRSAGGDEETVCSACRWKAVGEGAVG